MKTSLALVTLAALLAGGSSAVGSGARRVAGHVPSARIRQSRHLGRHEAHSRIQLAVSLQLRDQAGLQDLLGSLYDPSSPDFHQFLSSKEFKQRYAPSDADVATVAKSLSAQGLSIRTVTENNLLLNVEGSTAEVENAFQLELHDYITPDGRQVFAPSNEPLLMGDAAERVIAVHGLSSFSRRRVAGHSTTRIDPASVGSRASVSDYMTPSKIRTAYGLTSVAQTGAGETLALFELDGYNSSDITHFASYFSLTMPTLQNVLVSDGSTTANGSAGADTDEVALDIEVAMATAPGLSKIMVYEGPNTDQGVLNTYSKIANDNAAKEVSTSWGEPEDGPTASYRNAENTIFQQMASQGQSIFAAAGDSGAYDDYSNRATTLIVDDPASQPYVTAVGGTTLTSNISTGAYGSETSWGTTSNHEGGGGGASKFWSQPSWQAGLSNSSNKGSSSMRMVPDVSLDANPTSGYPVYVTYPGQAAAWYAIGGTSAAAPVWAAFMAIVNQGRVSSGVARIGFANPSIYQVGNSSLYANSFHDISDGSTNLFYPAVTGYDLSTGWGTLKGAGLYTALAAGTLPPTAPTTLTTISSAASVTANWSGASNATSFKVYRSSSGTAGSFALLASGVTGTSYVDSSVTALAYYYVTAVNAAGESGASPIAQGAPGLSPPGAPGSLTGTVIK